MKSSTENKKLTMMNECYECIYKKNVPGDAHISCINPDFEMTGSEYGIKKGWFFYPVCFDPTWKTKLCSNFKIKNGERL